MSDNDRIKFDDTLERPSFDPKDHGLDNSFRLTRFAARDGFIEPGYAIDGDVLVLTKPLGTQLALNAYQYITGKGTRCKRMQLKLTDEEVQQTHRQAIKCMSRLNRVAAGLMFKHNAHGATHIGELGLLGHAQHLASLQRNAVSFSIYNLPLIKNVEKLARSIIDANNKLLQGRAPEHSGGLFICMPQEQATAFCKDLKRLDGHSAWIIGLVEKGNRTARLVQSPRAIPVKNE
ncbi:GL10282 [Drosophila persimilis]|uniref:GL10282 n=1 Tax=Drosophila persimilis TaxID=7234 RepID=B4H9K8_DROPE|nr:GL10282 [Drosophila persimilis]